MSWTFKNGIPIYQQIVERMELLIARGELSPGSRIPAVRDLALEAGVNPNTMQRALQELERSGLVRSERTTGRFVTEDTKALQELRMRLSDTLIREMFAGLTSLGLSPDEIVHAVQLWKDSHAENS